MANVSFKKGLLANLPAAKSAGTIWVTTDERGMYIDIDDSTRIRLGDFQEFETVAALEANTNPSTTALYYVKAINCLAKWDGSKYVQINLDTGATSIEVVGSGNAVTSASYDAATRKITLTKGETFATNSTVEGILDGEDIDSFADVESALSGKQDTIPANTYDDYGAASTAKSEVTGASTDTSDKITLYGVKAYAKEQADAVLGKSTDAATANTVYGAKAAAAAAKTEAEAKVASVTAGDDSVAIAGTATAPTVAAKLDPTDGNALKLVSGKGLRVDIPSAAEYSLKKLDEASSGASASYQLTKDNVGIGAVIDIPKDMVVSSGTVETKTEAGDWGEAGTYIVLTIANKTQDKLYINVSDLIEYVTSGSQTGDMVFITIDPATHKVTATITDGTITLAKLHTDVQGKINQAHTHDNKTVLDGITAAKVSAWDDAESNAKSYADGLADNYDAAGAAAGVKSEVIGASTDAKTADTINGAKAFATDAAGTAQTNAVNTVVGTDADTKDSNTVNGAKKYADSVIGDAMAWGSF